MLHFVDPNARIDWATVCDWVHYDRQNEMTFLLDILETASGSVLEIGCNVGGLTALLASHGLQVCAVDSSKVMLNEARNRIEDPEIIRRVAFKELSFSEIEQLFGQQYELVLVPSNSFMSVLEPKDQELFLSNVAKLLVPGGALILVNATPQLRWLVADPAVNYHYKDVVKEGGQRLILSTQSDYDDYTQLGEIRVYAEFLKGDGVVSKKIVQDIYYRLTYAREMHNLLKLCGYGHVQVYDGFDKKPLGLNSTSMVWVGRF
ncbi:MAG: class I SAM-dependent methyltransferase [Anaerolineales bacterium]|nr:class I SAM-dependent methyltransferase [Anaerolineales bacterium]